ncbi:MAG: proton extrusion protein PcxA [Cyanothece sp. SIO1E1]|nr:proton extrusion protein PcxA [Cyanothece sp. SIO1E1]
MNIKGSLNIANQWFFKTPIRALDHSYEAALTIEALEERYFGGNRISASTGDYSESIQAYFRIELKKYLRIVKIRLAEFKASNSFLEFSSQQALEAQLSGFSQAPNTLDTAAANQSVLLLKKLKFIDAVLLRYQNSDKYSSSLNSSPLTLRPEIQPRNGMPSNGQVNQRDLHERVSQPQDNLGPRVEALSDRTTFLPRSIFRTVDRLKQELDPNAEEDVVRSFRTSKTKTTIALRFILLLIIIPLLTQQVSKTFLVGPIVDRLRSDTQDDVFLNIEMEEDALHELQRFEERLRFEVLIGKAPPLPEAEIETTVRQKAGEIEEDYRHQSANAIKNVFADIFATVAFGGLLVASKREIAILKSFIDEIVYGLSDSAKAFIIILFTDTFVGFHSPHGWEVLLEGLSRHLGLPANRNFIFLFIATFPVILDTVFKYWIFRYLNRISPSAVATYKNMNE